MNNKPFTEPAGTEVLIVPLECIRINPFQPRRTFSEEGIQELADSIRALGILQPPLVRRFGDGFELIAGERRCRAAKLAGLVEIPVVIRLADDGRSAEAALVENIQRVDLDALEIAQAIQQLMHDWNLSQEEVAVKVGKQRSTIANYLRLLSLPPSVQSYLREGTLSMGHAKAVLSLQDPYQQELLSGRIIKENLNVRQAEALARKLGAKQKKPLSHLLETDLFLNHLAQELQRDFGTKVSIRGNSFKGEVVFNYYSLDDLNRLLEMWNVS